MASRLYGMIEIIALFCGSVGWSAVVIPSASPPVTRHDFYAAMKQILSKADSALIDLKAKYGNRPSNRTPDLNARLTDIEGRLKGLHDSVNSLSAVREGDLATVEKKITERSRKLDRDIADLERQMQ